MTNSISSSEHVGLIRRLMAIFYDALLLIAILLLVTVLSNALNHGESIEPDNPYYPLFVALLLVISFFYYGWFWTHGGQTLGMQTWRMKLIDNENKKISWQQVFIRIIAALISFACFGTGFLWSLFDSERHTWHDMLSRSSLIDLRELK